MIGNNTRPVRAIVGFSVLTLLLAAATCAAPDAKPTAEIEPPPDASGGSGGVGGSGGESGAGGADVPDAPSEPIAGDPVWRDGYGEATNDQKLFDIALDPAANALVATIGYITAIKIPGLNNDMPYISGSLDSPAPITVQNILVFKQDAATHMPTWAVPIRAGAEIVRSTVDVDPQGNVIVAGGFIGKVEIPDMPMAQSGLSNGSYDGYIAKLDPSGKPVWLRTFGAAGEDYVTDVAVDGDGNIVVVGYSTSATVDFGDGKPLTTIANKDIFVAKYDKDGNTKWAQRVGEAGATDIMGNHNWREPSATVEVSRADGSIFIGGIYRGALSFPPVGVPASAAEDGFIVKLDADGVGKWHLEFGSANCKQRVRSVAIGPKGEVALTGSFQGNVTIGDQTKVSFKGSQDLLIAMLEPDGQPRWVRNYGSLGNQLGTKVLIDEKGRAFVGGSFTGSIDFFNGGTLTNTTKELPFTPTDIFVAKLKEDGTPLWAHAWGDTDPNGLVGIQTIEGGVFWKNDKNEPFVVFGGINSGSIDFGGMVQFLKSAGFEDAYLMSITY